MGVRPMAILGCAVIGSGALLTGCGVSPEYVDDVDEEEIIYEAAESPSRRPEVSWVGRWIGVGHQSNGSSWDMRLTVTGTGPGECAKVDYPSVGCSGYWDCAPGFDGAQIQAVEIITDGKDRCIDEVQVVLAANPDGRTVSFQGTAGDITAEARLGRDAR
jgi:hypothetical protein